MKHYDTFLIVGAERAPECHSLTVTMHAHYNQARALNIDNASAKAVPAIFGHGAELAFPCWHDAMMEWCATEYSGPHAEAVRGMAACILTDTPFNNAPDLTEGGQRVPLPDAPLPKSPSPARAVRELEAVRVDT